MQCKYDNVRKSLWKVTELFIKNRDPCIKVRSTKVMLNVAVQDGVGSRRADICLISLQRQRGTNSTML